MKIHLPNSAWIGNIDPFLRSFDTEDASRLEITSHEKWFSVHPLVLSMVVSLGLSIKANNPIDSAIDFKVGGKSKHYLERMNVFKILGIDSGISVTEHEASGRFIPIAQINDSSELHNFITEMVPLLHKEPAQAEPIRYVVSELVRNVFEHSESPHGAIVCAQFYKKSNTVRLGVADTGVGITRTINAAYPDSNDLKSIALALTPGVTGTTNAYGGTEANAGAGLFFIKSIATVNRDFFMIYSGKGMYKLLKTPLNKRIKLNSDPLKDNCSTDDNLPYWAGTVVGIDISLDTNQDFDDLLDLVRKVYQKRERKNGRRSFKRPRFI